MRLEDESEAIKRRNYASKNWWWMGLIEAEKKLEERIIYKRKCNNKGTLYPV